MFMFLMHVSNFNYFDDNILPMKEMFLSIEITYSTFQEKGNY